MSPRTPLFASSTVVGLSKTIFTSPPTYPFVSEVFAPVIRCSIIAVPPTSRYTSPSTEPPSPPPTNEKSPPPTVPPLTTTYVLSTFAFLLPPYIALKFISIFSVKIA